MSVTDLPDCPWCDTAQSLTKVIIGLETPIYECSCCSKLFSLDNKNRAQRVPQREKDERPNDQAYEL